MKLDVSMEPPASDWIHVRLGPEEFDVSSSPSDGIEDLVTALRAVSQSQTTREVHWHLEPEVVVLEFARVDQTVSLSFHDFVFTGTRDAVVRPFCTALERLRSPTYEREWRHPFPDRAVVLLRASLRAA